MEFGNSRGEDSRFFGSYFRGWLVKFEGGGVVDEVSQFEGGRIRRISSDFMGYPKIFPSSRGPGGARGPGMRSGGQRWDQGGQG